MKKKYESPRVLTTEKIIGRAATCSKTDDQCRASGGPVEC